MYLPRQSIKTFIDVDEVVDELNELPKFWFKLEGDREYRAV